MIALDSSYQCILNWTLETHSGVLIPPIPISHLRVSSFDLKGFWKIKKSTKSKPCWIEDATETHGRINRTEDSHGYLDPSSKRVKNRLTLNMCSCSDIKQKLYSEKLV